jgi:hypothetical protein
MNHLQQGTRICYQQRLQQDAKLQYAAASVGCTAAMAPFPPRCWLLLLVVLAAVGSPLRHSGCQP